jgi:hypothetical protein
MLKLSMRDAFAIEFEDYMLNKMRGISVPEHEEGQMRGGLFGTPEQVPYENDSRYAPENRAKVLNKEWVPNADESFNERDWGVLDQTIPEAISGPGSFDRPGFEWTPHDQRNDLSNGYEEWRQKQKGQFNRDLQIGRRQPNHPDDEDDAPFNYYT